MNSFASKAVLASGSRAYTIYRLPALEARGFNLSRLPFSLKILLIVGPLYDYVTAFNMYTQHNTLPPS